LGNEIVDKKKASKPKSMFLSLLPKQGDNLPCAHILVVLMP
jgi:hypothetical protein